MGEPTEAALKVLVEKLGVPGLNSPLDPQLKCRQANDFYSANHRKLATLSFSRDRKSMSVLARNDDQQRNRLFVKGAAEILIDRCSKVQLGGGTVIKLNDDLRAQITQQIFNMSQRPLRCLALAVSEQKITIIAHVKRCCSGPMSWTSWQTCVPKTKRLLHQFCKIQQA